ncbi:amino acid ABC transporter permease [Actinopolymorpha singaporensis]|uniref:Amino acid ABC transporter membrane protein, PAAT family n=1 Tax=Actinopolymorpha singaporensis TaxID=117157 RepID=A0A1H1QUF6_9ACTN|nr:amino acid ABC transporter permease [Actinopolymorpha singaporensis]SDS27027.1 amino acid ABC transporter membrane protein, PAAT family [Actinopolymorpha singaporensis]
MSSTTSPGRAPGAGPDPRGEAGLPGHRPSPLQVQRDRYRSRQTVRSVLVAAVSTAVVGLVLYVALTGAPGWERVRASFLDPQVARQALPHILSGLWLNLRLLLACAACSLLLGLLIAFLRTLRGPVAFPIRALSTGYTYAFRGVPLIIVIYVMALGVPGLRLRGTPGVIVLGAAAIILTYSAYLAEVFRAGIESVHPSQRAAARSLGLSYRQTMRYVVLPQAVRRVSPPLLNDLVAMQKDVGLISLAGPIDAVRAAEISVGTTYNFTPYVVAGALFVALAVPLVAVTDAVTVRAARRQSAEGSA